MPVRIDAVLLKEIRGFAESLGFSGVGAVPADGPDAAFRDFYRRFLKRGLAADLTYLERPERFDPRAVFADAKTILVFSYPYRFPAIEKKLREAPFKVARYAWQRDYHNLLKEKLARVLERFHLIGRAVTDSAPLAERYWARRAGLGKIGKNGMLIDPLRGSYFMIASLLVEEELASIGVPALASTAVFDDRDRALDSLPIAGELSRDFSVLCAGCNLCVDACPTGALFGDGLMNVQKCLSYQTIENKAAEIPRSAKRHRWLFGCDICQQVCPHNKADRSFADNAFCEEHLAAAKIALGGEPDNRSELKDSVFFRRGIAALKRNRAALEP